LLNGKGTGTVSPLSLAVTNRDIISLQRRPLGQAPASLFWCLAIGLYIGVALSDLTDRYVFYINRTVYIVIILSATVAASNLAGKIFRNYIGRTSFPIPATGLAYGVLKGTILVVGRIV